MSRKQGTPVGNRCYCVPSQQLESRLATYAAAAAAGMTALGTAQPAEAQMVYTPAHVVIRPGTTYDLDLNHDQHNDFRFTDGFSRRGSVGSLYVTPFASNQGQIGNGVEVKSDAIFSPLALNRGARIGGSKAFYGSCIGCNSSLEIMAWADPFADFGDWVNVQNRYLGLRLFVDQQAHFGWARFSIRVEKNRVTALLTGYAYEPTPNKPIIAGQISGTADDEAPGPEPQHRPVSQGMLPASLGVLALGAQGLSLWRNALGAAQ